MLFFLIFYICKFPKKLKIQISEKILRKFSPNYLFQTTSPTTLNGAFQLNDQLSIPKNYTLIYGSPLNSNSKVYPYSLYNVYNHSVNSNSFMISHFRLDSSVICTDCSIASSYCLGNGFCECFTGVSHACSCSIVSKKFYFIFYFFFF